MPFTTSYDLDVPAATAFDAFADARNEPHWNSAVTESTMLSPEPVGAGSRFRTVNRNQPYDAVITTYEPSTRLGFEVTGKGMDISTMFTFTDHARGCTVHEEFDFRPTGPMRLAFPLMRPMIARDLPKQGARFKRWIESRQDR